MCQKSFKTHHRLMVHMGVHCGENSHVVSVGRCLPPGGCGQRTQRLVCQVTRLHALTVVRSMPVLKGCISTTGPSMVLRPLPREGSYVLSVVKGTKSKRPGWNTSPIVPTTLTTRVYFIVGLLAAHQQIIPSPV